MELGGLETTVFVIRKSQNFLSTYINKGEEGKLIIS